jgi:hypothetical protein
VDCHAHIVDRFERYPFSSCKKCSPCLCSREAWLALHAALGVERGVQVHGSPYGFDVSVDLSAGSWKGGFDYGYWGPQVYLTARF